LAHLPPNMEDAMEPDNDETGSQPPSQQPARDELKRMAKRKKRRTICVMRCKRGR
jgi:hypothetical protein